MFSSISLSVSFCFSFFLFLTFFIPLSFGRPLPPLPTLAYPPILRDSECQCFRSSNTCSVLPLRVVLFICAGRCSSLTSFWLPTRIQLSGKALLHVYRVQYYLQILVFLRPIILFILINILGLEPSTHSSVSITISFGKSFATTIFLWIEDTNFCFISESLQLLIRSTILFYFPFGQTNNIADKLFK